MSVGIPTPCHAHSLHPILLCIKLRSARCLKLYFRFVVLRDNVFNREPCTVRINKYIVCLLLTRVYISYKLAENSEPTANGHRRQLLF